MLRTTIPLSLACCVLAVVLPVQSAPALKETEKPLPPATPAQRAKSTNNLKQIGLAMHNYHDTHGHFPTNTTTKDGKPGLSWRVAILPFIEEDQLYKQFKMDEPWDSEHNIKLADKLPKVYAPVRGRAKEGETFYQMFAGGRTLLGAPGKGVMMADITDGMSNTFMAVEGGKPVIWTKPDDLSFDGKTLPKLGGIFDGDFHAVFGDGAVRRIPKGTDASVLKLAIDRADGNPLNLDDAIKKAKD